MIDVATEQKPALMMAAVEITAAYVSHNHVQPSDLPMLIQTIYVSLTGLASQGSAPNVAIETGPKLTPAQIRKSITPNALISFVDGMAYKTLKRHLGRHGLDPHSYRQKFGLPDEYPMVAPSYSERRSMLAKDHSFGRRSKGRPKKAD